MRRVKAELKFGRYVEAQSIETQRVETCHVEEPRMARRMRRIEAVQLATKYGFLILNSNIYEGRTK